MSFAQFKAQALAHLKTHGSASVHLGAASSATKPEGKVPFSHARARLTIGSLDEHQLTVTAHYNPAELTVKKSVPWGPKGEQGTPEKDTGSEQDSHQFNGAPTRAMSLELLFDGYEDHRSIEPIVQQLEKLSEVRDPTSHKSELRRPHFCVVTWGDGGIKPFRCVITSLSVRYTMFSAGGRPLRATCSIELQEARLKSSFGGATGAELSAARAVASTALALARAVGL